MSIVDNKYRQLKPELGYLSDPAVLAQAWKKTHAYIRSYNWYSDTLELDCSAINLEQFLNEWSKELTEGEYTPTSMRLVPAPKADHWTFYQDPDGNWKWGPEPSSPEEDDDASTLSPVPKELRPLAHLTIKDQTIATSIMLCLADAVETAQGSTDPKHSHDVYSYGNRLFCDWDGDQARFRWGNSTTYSKYFQDYQRFLDRPRKKAQKIQATLSPGENLFEIHLDLSAFFDNINRDKLLESLEVLARKHYDIDDVGFEAFWNVVRKIIRNWHWEEKDLLLAPCMKNGVLQPASGLPQGLVAGGFLANAYLLDVDRRFSELIKQELNGVVLLDYCRYVDDMRLLVKVTGEEPSSWHDWVTKNFNALMEEAGLEFNTEKTKVERYTSRRSGVSVRMQAIQQAASGPQDAQSLDEMLGSLEGLLSLAEQIQDQGSQFNGCTIPLSKIDRPQMDVREDTILRFAANRISRAFREKRLIEIPNDDDCLSLTELDHTQEAIARRFIAIWARNPALVALLKKGFELFPHPDLLMPVMDALLNKVSIYSFSNEKEQRVAWYTLTEIYRLSALNLNRQRTDERPAHSDWSGFRQYLAEKARGFFEVDDNVSLFSKSRQPPWYLQQQMALFLSVYGEGVQIQGGDITDDYRLLHRILRGDRRFGAKDSLEKRLPLFIVAYQVSENHRKVAENFGDWLTWLIQKGQNSAAKNILVQVALNAQQMFVDISAYGKAISATWLVNIREVSSCYGVDITPLPGDLSDYNREFVNLGAVLARVENPFSHENALLLLAVKILSRNEVWVGDVPIVPQSTKIRCSHWENIQKGDKATCKLKLEFSSIQPEDNRYNLPGWVRDEIDNKKLYWTGCFLRACLTGDPDFTSAQFLVREETSSIYFGLRTSWFKRRVGMSHQPEAVHGDAASFTSWISELLYRLLQWPGLEVRTYEDEWNIRFDAPSVLKLLKRRLTLQRKLYAKSTGMPVYIEKIHRDFADKKSSLRIVMVQSLLPLKKDFLTVGCCLDTPGYRNRHRAHIATMSKLIIMQLEAAERAAGEFPEKPMADLIIMPELAVHNEDVDLLEQLAAKTGAMIHTGLVFHKQRGQLINTALWLIPHQNDQGGNWIKRYQGKKESHS